MLTEASVGDVAGINGVEWDAVELPSQVRHTIASFYTPAPHSKIIRLNLLPASPISSWRISATIVRIFEPLICLCTVFELSF
jgi:hypothetical protein